MRWEDFHLALTLAREGSLSGAARALGVEHSTVHRRLVELEGRLGFRLFDRRRDGCSPTRQGGVVAEAAAAMEKAALEGALRLAGSEEAVSGTVRLATSELLALRLLPTAWGRLSRDLPTLQVEVTVSNSSVDLTRREADLALRATNSPPEHLVGRRLAEIRYGLFATPELVGAAPTAESLAASPWLGFDERIASFPNARWLAAHPPLRAPTLVFDSSMAMAHAAAAGCGIAVLPLFAGNTVPGLARLGEPIDAPPMGLWLLRHNDVGPSPRIRALASWLSDAVPKLLAELSESSLVVPVIQGNDAHGSARD
jgi:DNA-binding transcriptional LysR family regulator